MAKLSILRVVAAATSLVAACCAVQAQTVKARILQPIDETQLVTLAGNVPGPALDSRNDRGVVSASLPLNHLRLVLRRSPESDAALKQRIEAMHDPRSPLYHQWLTAAELGV